MNKNRIIAIVVRHLYSWRRDYDRLTDAFYWPAIDIFLWGFAASYMSRMNGANNQLVVAILTGAVFYMVIWRSQIEMTVGLLQEMWAKNIGNLFSSPLTIYEWVVSVLILGIIKMAITISFATTLIFLLYKTNVFTIGFYFIPYLISLLMTGWTIGFLVCGLILYFGTRIQTIAWAGAGLIMPFIGIYYPVNTLPLWAQTISHWLPVSYVFEGMRKVLFTGIFDIQGLMISYVLNLCYLGIAILFFLAMFKKSRNLGLMRLQ